MEKRMPTTSSASPHLEPHIDDQPKLSSSFASQAHTIVQSLIPSMTDHDIEVPKTGDEVLPSSGGAALRPPVHHGPKVSKFVIFMRKIYRPIGFHKGYNFPLFVVFAGAMLGFTLAKISNLNVTGTARGSFKSQAAPGEWYYFSQGRYLFGLALHLATVLPAGFLMVWQFVPVIRQRYLTFHRINGYVVIVMIVLSNIGALMIAQRSFGGGLDVQTAVGVLVILSTTSLGMALWNIWCIQIELHRAWMLRAVFYMGTIITSRLIQAAAAATISPLSGYYQVQTCGQVASIFGGMSSAIMASNYSQCSNTTLDLPVVVTANMHGSPVQMGASLGLSFGMALWMSILLHLIGVEIYLNLTPAETERMRNVSHARQLEAGFSRPGSMGTTTDRWGDAPAWPPAPRDRLEVTERPGTTSSIVPMVEK